MNSKKRFYKDIDFLRLVACLAILLYHLNILKGGYLAVSTFFVLSGYLSCVSACKKEKFSIKEYYKKKIVKIYIPLLIVVFLTTLVVPLFKDINWLNLKPETTSVLLGYNNYWQLSANLDYFAHHISSPFMHFWYISILLQFDLVFPFIYKLLKKCKDKIHRLFPCIITILGALGGAIYYYYMSKNGNFMTTYYDTFARAFSLLFGVGLGFIHSYYTALVPKFLRGKIARTIVKTFYFIALILSFIFIGSNSSYFALVMILDTLISCRLLDYAVITPFKESNLLDKFIENISCMSYEIYLFQYPLIFLFQYTDLPQNLQVPFIIIATLLLSFLLHQALNFNRKKETRFIKYLLLLIILHLSFIGLYNYIVAIDHTAEMKELEHQLAENEKMLAIKQEEYTSKLKEEEEKWLEILNSFENSEAELKEHIATLPVVGIGDSVMLGAIDNLYDRFENGYFDAKISRSMWVTNGILKELKEEEALGDPIVLNLGANGDCSEACKKAILETCENRKIFWVNVTNDKDVHVNDNLRKLENEYANVHIVDWESISNGHTEYFYADGIHLTGSGRIAYTQAIYDKIYEVYLEEYNAKKESILKEHKASIEKKMSFYGNGLLLNAFDELESEFKEAKFNTNKEYDADKLIESIKKAEKDKTLNHRVILVLDKSANLTATDYKNIIELTEGHSIYIINTDSKLSTYLQNIARENVTVIDIANRLNDNDDYLLADGIHLSSKGNEVLKEALIEVLK